MTRGRILLSRDGGDRATGYAMSAKVIRLADRLLCTWLDSSRRNRCALANPAGGEVISTGPMGALGVDNRCGAATTGTACARMYGWTCSRRDIPSSS